MHLPSLRLSQTPKGFIQPGQDIGVSAKLRPNQAPVSGAVLRYKVNYGAEKDIRMQADGAAGALAPAGVQAVLIALKSAVSSYCIRQNLVPKMVTDCICARIQSIHQHAVG